MYFKMFHSGYKFMVVMLGYIFKVNQNQLGSDGEVIIVFVKG